MLLLKHVCEDAQNVTNDRHTACKRAIFDFYCIKHWPVFITCPEFFIGPSSFMSISTEPLFKLQNTERFIFISTADGSASTV